MTTDLGGGSCGETLLWLLEMIVVLVFVCLLVGWLVGLFVCFVQDDMILGGRTACF